MSEDTDEFQRQLEASKMWPLFCFADEIGMEDPEQYVESLREDVIFSSTPDQEFDFRDAKGHCDRCCSKEVGDCRGCRGHIRSRNVAGLRGYGDQTESWTLHCPLCGEISEDDDGALAMMRVASCVSFEKEMQDADSVVPERFDSVRALLPGPGKLLLQHAEQYWERGAPFCGELLYLAAIVEGTPRQDIYAACRGDSFWSLSDLSGGQLESQLRELEDEAWAQLEPALRARAKVLRSEGWNDDADFLTELIEEVSWAFS